MGVLKISKNVFEIEMKEVGDCKHVALYHSISMDVVYVKKVIYEKIKNEIGNNDYTDFSGDVVNNLQMKKFIVPCEIDESDELCKIAESISVMKASTLRLQLTDVCNLNCTYCQIERNYKKNNQVHMSEDIATRSLKLFAKHAPKNTQKTIIFTGGEPMLNITVIERLFVIAKDLLDSYRFILFTNGTMITERIAKLLKENNVLVLISLDGNEELHDASRKDFFGKGSFREALNGYYICKKCECNVGISGVIGSHNITELDSKVIDFFINIGLDSLGLNFTHYLLNEDNTKILHMADYSNAIISAYKKLRDHGIYLENINRVIEPFVKQKINAKECAGLGRGITVLPDGTVGPCKTLLVADVIGAPIDEIEKLEKLEDSSEFLKWRNRSTYTLECCKECVGISLCGSGCAYDSYVVNGNIDGVDKRTCIFIEKILGFLINDLYLHMQDSYNLDIIIPTSEDRKKIYSSITIAENSLNRSAGHEI